VLPVYAATKSAQAQDKVATLLSRRRPSYIRCALIERIGQLTTGCRGAGCQMVAATLSDAAHDVIASLAACSMFLAMTLFTSLIADFALFSSVSLI